MRSRLIFTALILGISMTTGACKPSPGNGTTASQATETATETTAGNSAVEHWTSDKKITPDSGMPVIIDFNAAWCGPCRMFKPVFERIALKYADKARFISVNVDNCPNAATQFSVQAIPQISILYSDGRVENSTGYMDDTELDALVSHALGSN